jgi:polysaccharide biosynthesis protein PslF
MKVLIISAFPPEPAPEANHALHLSEHLAESGVSVEVLCKKGSIAPAHKNIVVHPIIHDWSWWDLPRLAKCLKKSRPDVVLLLYIGWIYNHHPMITFLPTICRSVLPGLPCVTQFENIDEALRPRSFVMRVLRKAMTLWAGRKGLHFLLGTLVRDSVRIIVLSGPHRARLNKQGSEAAEKSVILPPPPLLRLCPDDPLTARKRARDAIGAAETDFVLIYWGYIYPGKGVETLLQAFRIVCRQKSDMRLILVGGPLDFPTGPISCSDYFQMVRQLPEKLGIADRVTWTGHFNWDSDIGSRYLHASDACVLPFDYGVTLNNSSLAAASTHGLPVISTELRVGRDEGLEHGRNIYLCRPKDPEMLAEAIQLISDNADFRGRLRSGILDLAQDWYSWDVMTERMIEVLESAVSCGEAPGQNQSQSSVATCGAEARKEKESSDNRSYERDGELLEVQGEIPHLSSLAQSEQDNVDAPLVSVIVAVYNVEKYLSQCLDSLVNQTLKNIEILVIDDASTDNSAGIINDYKARYPNIRVVNCEYNKGLASVRNIGLRLARGQYVGFTDGDDWVDIRMCEIMYQRASDDNADVLIADANVFYEDTKTFGQFFDQHIRKTLNPQLKTMPFELRSDFRILLLEPVAWPKLYKRSFLQKQGLHFEDGMNSYEDICFHFSVLLKATRISLTDDALFFYRQNRPGQISGRTSRKVFEVFVVFDKIQEKLTAWDVSAEIWALLVRVQLRQFDWLLRDRVQSHHKREFLASVAKQLEMIPERGFRNFAQQANIDQLTKLFCMRRNWLHAYEKVVRSRWPVFPLLYAIFYTRRRGILKRAFQRCLEMLRRQVLSLFRSFVKKLLRLTGVEHRFFEFEKQLQTVNNSLNQVTTQSDETLVQVCRIHEQILFLSSSRSYKSGLPDALRRMEHDYYLSQTAIFREGDTVVDIGAHVGVVSIYLAKKYPFIKIYAIEPEPSNYDCLKRNIELNGITNVIAINKAISRDGQKRTLYSDARDSSWATIDKDAASSCRVLRTVQVDTVTLERLFQEYDIRHCRLLKMTAPGAIQESLQGFTRTGCVDLLCGEVDLADCNQVKLEMASWRIARQHFWRTFDSRAHRTAHSWIHRMPTEIEQLPAKTSSSANLPSGLIIHSPQ